MNEQIYTRFYLEKPTPKRGDQNKKSTSSETHKNKKNYSRSYSTLRLNGNPQCVYGRIKCTVTVILCLFSTLYTILSLLLYIVYRNVILQEEKEVIGYD